MWLKNLGEGINEDGYCGYKEEFSVILYCNSMRIEFKFDDLKMGKGFNVIYEIIRDLSKMVYLYFLYLLF